MVTGFCAECFGFALAIGGAVSTVAAIEKEGFGVMKNIKTSSTEMYWKVEMVVTGEFTDSVSASLNGRASDKSGDMAEVPAA